MRTGHTMSDNFDQPGSADDSRVAEQCAGNGSAGDVQGDRCAAARPAAGKVRGRRARPRGPSASAKKGRGARGERSSRELSLTVMAREYIWLWDTRHGIGTKEIAMRDGVHVQRVRMGIARARALETRCPTDPPVHLPRLIPLFPIAPYTPQSTCGHHRPIEVGSAFCCMVCHCSGMDDHPGLLRSPLTDPTPELKPDPVPEKSARETRKQRRQRLYKAAITASPQ